MSNICHPQTGWLSLHDPVIFKSYIKECIVCPAKRLQFLFVASHTTCPLHPGFRSA